LEIPYSSGYNSESIGGVLETTESYILNFIYQNILLIDLREKLTDKLIIKFKESDDCYA
jgi:hypothetical protein